MMTTSRKLKTIALAAAIGAATLMQAGRVEARDMQTITVAGGCFWCVESDFEKVRGVAEVTSGYTGGSTANPTYRQVTGGGTGHYEAVEIRYDADQVSARQIFDLFFRSVDPTDAGGQFCDRGDSYRTAIFVSNTAEQQVAEAALASAQSALGQRIVTPILPLSAFYDAEEYHQDYYKGQDRVITRGGIKTEAEAYAFYREACGRDARVEQLWGSNAPFINH
ncbi:peptide-methionine (S)-S-oxide reductase MsrA [Octadecabacter sp. 1_MG-2023]|uniref:peptide-methionine (S)-S-oxide reductase MsrA n=1 Tax=unclassified Octadecabacter TaxID=196158 RepID=UPI001C085AEC|nr:MULTISPECIES: peptide-methionine (S)-S-oxide reductase MsrA [unclassified Octadecabacter]MBU2992299.1 peptide-methionine (S)-S-oxide reductase MsrA [Octadecabacter sp. B2R22]MDO6734944.1 peptide-methionine (S)-S-oxide reductase MsrA [Octadecabacter sp. 1_MG-2023]